MKDGGLDQLIAQAEDLDRQLQVLDGQREDLVAMRRSRLRAAIEEADMDAVAARLGITRSRLIRLITTARTPKPWTP